MVVEADESVSPQVMLEKLQKVRIAERDDHMIGCTAVTNECRVAYSCHRRQVGQRERKVGGTSFLKANLLLANYVMVAVFLSKR